MEHSKRTLLCSLLILPLLPLAYRSEEWRPMLLQLISAILFTAVIITLKESTASKLLISSIYALTVIIILSLLIHTTYGMYLDRMDQINTAIALIPLSMAGISYLALKAFQKEKIKEQ